MSQISNRDNLESHKEIAREDYFDYVSFVKYTHDEPLNFEDWFVEEYLPNLDN